MQYNELQQVKEILEAMAKVPGVAEANEYINVSRALAKFERCNEILDEFLLSLENAKDSNESYALSLESSILNLQIEMKELLDTMQDGAYKLKALFDESFKQSFAPAWFDAIDFSELTVNTISCKYGFASRFQLSNGYILEIVEFPEGSIDANISRVDGDVDYFTVNVIMQMESFEDEIPHAIKMLATLT